MSNAPAPASVIHERAAYRMALIDAANAKGERLNEAEIEAIEYRYGMM